MEQNVEKATRELLRSFRRQARNRMISDGIGQAGPARRLGVSRSSVSRIGNLSLGTVAAVTLAIGSSPGLSLD